MAELQRYESSSSVRLVRGLSHRVIFGLFSLKLLLVHPGYVFDCVTVNPNTMLLTELPPELLRRIASGLRSPRDLAAFRATARATAAVPWPDLDLSKLPVSWWRHDGLARLVAATPERVVLPYSGPEFFTTPPPGEAGFCPQSPLAELLMLCPRLRKLGFVTREILILLKPRVAFRCSRVSSYDEFHSYE